MQSISFCFIDFENVPSRKMYRVQSIKFNTSTATVGRINQNGIATFGKFCHLPRAGTAMICTVIKRATGARAGRPQYPYFETQILAKLVQ